MGDASHRVRNEHRGTKVPVQAGVEENEPAEVKAEGDPASDQEASDSPDLVVRYEVAQASRARLIGTHNTAVCQSDAQ